MKDHTPYTKQFNQTSKFYDEKIKAIVRMWRRQMALRAPKWFRNSVWPKSKHTCSTQTSAETEIIVRKFCCKLIRKLTISDSVESKPIQYKIIMRRRLKDIEKVWIERIFSVIHFQTYSSYQDMSDLGEILIYLKRVFINHSQRELLSWSFLSKTFVSAIYGKGNALSVKTLNTLFEKWGHAQFIYILLPMNLISHR